MTGESSVVAEVVVKLISNLLDHVVGPRAKIVYFETQPAFAVLGRQQVNTHRIVIQNLGRKEVEAVRVIHNWKRDGWDYNVSPLRGCHPLPMQGGQVAFTIDFIRSRESIFITYIYGTPPPEPLLHSISTSEREAERIEFPIAPRQYPNWVIACLGLLALVGGGVVLHYVVKVIGAVWHALSS
jgi:hypothetical protein